MQTLLTSSMRIQPVDGWRSSVVDLGLPGATPGSAAASRIATAEDPFHSAPFIGNLGDSAYFIVGAPASQWSLVAIDVRNGSRLFAPVLLDAGVGPPDCFLNGPDSLLCLNDDVENVTAWVIDAHSGTVTHRGPTDLRTSPAKLVVRQVGIYAVAETQYQGLFGVGPEAETTWFVPGDGSVDQKYLGPRDVARPALATQTSGGPDGKVVFSLTDGKVIKPEMDENAEQQQTVVYPGGFAAVIEFSETRREVQFFDVNGKRLSREGVRGLLNANATDLPMINLTSGGWAVYTPDGDRVLQAPGVMPQESRLVGERLFVKDPNDTMVRRWQQYDLRTGGSGKECNHDLGGGYLGTDGQVGVFKSGNPNIGLATKAMDLATCDTLWTIESPVGSFRHVWRINTTLVELSDDGTELMSLVAPS